VVGARFGRRLDAKFRGTLSRGASSPVRRWWAGWQCSGRQRECDRALNPIPRRVGVALCEGRCEQASARACATPGLRVGFRARDPEHGTPVRVIWPDGAQTRLTALRHALLWRPIPTLARSANELRDQLPLLG